MKSNCILVYIWTVSSAKKFYSTFQISTHKYTCLDGFVYWNFELRKFFTHRQVHSMLCACMYLIYKIDEVIFIVYCCVFRTFLFWYWVTFPTIGYNEWFWRYTFFNYINRFLCVSIGYSFYKYLCLSTYSFDLPTHFPNYANFILLLKGPIHQI